MRKLKASVFLLAAELQHSLTVDKRIKHPKTGGFLYCDLYSCVNLLVAAEALDISTPKRSTYDYRNLYRDLFYSPEEACTTSCWWPRRNGAWDYESRIFALLLAAEVVKDQNRKK